MSTDFFGFVQAAGAPFARILDGPPVVPVPAAGPRPPRRSVRAWQAGIDLAPIREEIAALPPFAGPAPEALRALVVAPGVDAALHERFTRLYGEAPAFVCFAMEPDAFSRLSEDQYLELHVALGYSAQVLWLALLRRGLGCVPYGRVEGGRPHDLAGAGLRPLFSLAVGVPLDAADAS